MRRIWGPKTVSLFDVRSIDHFFAGIGVGALAVSIVNSVFKKYNIKAEKEISDNVSEGVSEVSLL